MTPTTTLSTHQLLCHPATPAGTPLNLSVALNQTAEGLRLVYAVKGNLAALLVPSAKQPGAADNLWQHTCLEAFAAAEGDAGYHEFNFSPSGQWALYRFASERIREAPSHEAGVTPLTQTTSDPERLILAADLSWTALPLQSSALNIGLSAVIEETDGRLSYWALTHPGERPDFHHPASRALRLALPLTRTP